ncbi:AHH domain-containing protein, partial [Streptococcus suis]|nr:AHH domain-containing protein [Streptococcus suis]NQJ02392.1 AHH domain-containing protein [Streptococcus suis]
LISMGGSKFGKLAKVATKADNLFDVVKGSKIVTRANKAIDGTKTFIKSNVGKLLDTPFGFSPQLAGVGGMTMNAGGTTLREVGQNVKKGFDNLVQAFAKNGDETVHGAGRGGGSAKPNQIHHYATNKSKTYTPDMEKIASDYNLDLDGDWNKELLPHQGRHPNKYHDMVLEEMYKADAVAQGNREIFLELFEENVKKVIRKNPAMLYKDFWRNFGK